MIIGLTGYARSGKDSVAQILVRDHGYTQIAFADAVRECLLALNPLIEYKNDDPIRLLDGLRWYGWDGLKQHAPEVRLLLQRMGTEVGREIIDPDVWVDLTLDKMQEGENWVISDCRFWNEADRITESGGAVVRVERYGYGPANDHISEVALDNYPWPYILINNKTLADLTVNVNGLVRHLERETVHA